MITAVDTSVLLDVFLADEQFGPASREELRRALADGAVLACDIVWAEVGAAFPERSAAAAALDTLGIAFAPMTDQDALAAGEAWRRYRRAGGPRDRVIADFLIAAHAIGHAERLLTRDRGFYRRYFPRLSLLGPGAASR